MVFNSEVRVFHVKPTFPIVCIIDVFICMPHICIYVLYTHLPSAFPPPCLIGISVFGMSGMMGRLAALAGLAELVDGPIDRFIH